MKRRLVPFIATLIVMMFLSTNTTFSKVAGFPTVETGWLQIVWHGSWYTLCFADGGATCTIVLWGIPGVIDDIDCTHVPNDASLVILQSEKFFGLKDGEQVHISDHTYKPGSSLITKGELLKPVYIPAQTAIYREKYSGFVVYYYTD